MKKFLLFIFLLIYSFNSNAHMAHYNKFNKIEMEILRDGEVIGYNYYFFKKNLNNTTVTNQLKFTVKLFGATIFEVESYGEEKYINDKLISFNSKLLLLCFVLKRININRIINFFISPFEHFCWIKI